MQILSAFLYEKMAKVSSAHLKINKNPQNPLSALEAMLPVQIATKNCL